MNPHLYPFKHKFDMKRLREELSGDPGKLPLEFERDPHLRTVRLDRWEAPGQRETHVIKVRPSCRLPRGGPEYYLHRILIQCRYCRKWFPINSASQHVCHMTKNICKEVPV